MKTEYKEMIDDSFGAKIVEELYLAGMPLMDAIRHVRELRQDYRNISRN